jgi:hypothetical protein
MPVNEFGGKKKVVGAKDGFGFSMNETTLAQNWSALGPCRSLPPHQHAQELMVDIHPSHF